MPSKKVKKPTNIPDDPDTPQDESVEEVVEVDPQTQIAVDYAGNGTYSIEDAPVTDGRPEVNNRIVVIGGKPFEHVGEHLGLWAYRHLG